MVIREMNSIKVGIDKSLNKQMEWIHKYYKTPIVKEAKVIETVKEEEKPKKKKKKKEKSEYDWLLYVGGALIFTSTMGII